VELFEPCCFGNVSFIVNGPTYRVRGVETETIARPLHGLSVTGSAAWNSGSLTSSPLLYDTEGRPITSIPNHFGAPYPQSAHGQTGARGTFGGIQPYLRVRSVRHSNTPTTVPE
jgi:outer membrane receptor protein involved in Fe transport